MLRGVLTVQAGTVRNTKTIGKPIGSLPTLCRARSSRGNRTES